MEIKDNTVKLILSILLLICLFDMPYGYYQAIRFTAFIGFLYLAYLANQKNIQKEIFIYVLLAVLFQPFLKISLGRFLWNIVDLAVASWLLIGLFKNLKTKH